MCDNGVTPGWTRGRGRPTADAETARGRAVSFDCFGTLVSMPRPPSPAAAIGGELASRGVAVPDDWEAAYAEPHLDPPERAERSIPTHARAALSSRGIDAEPSVVASAVLDAYDREAERLPGAAEALAAVDAPVGVLSNCAVPGLVPRTLSQVDLLDPFEAVVTSIEIGWRKPDRRPFAAIADELAVPVGALVHVGDQREVDGGIERYGGRYLHVDGDLRNLPDRLTEAGVVAE